MDLSGKSLTRVNSLTRMDSTISLSLFDGMDNNTLDQMFTEIQSTATDDQESGKPRQRHVSVSFMGQAGAPAEDIPSERVMEELRNIMFPEDGTVVSALEHTGGSIQVPASVMLAPSSAAAGAQAEGGDPLQRCDSGIELMQHFELLLPDADVDTLPQAAVGAPAVECGSSNILGHHVQGDYANGTRKQIRADQLRSLVGDKGIGIVTHHRQPHDIRVLHISAEYLKELKAVHSAVQSGQSAVSSEQSTAPFSTADHTMLEMLSEFFAAAEAKGMGKGHTITNSVLWQCIHCNPTASSQGAWFP